ncbi:MAG: hypothetical protein ACM30G_20510 [Micromonosporaceae bacterium]
MPTFLDQWLAGRYRTGPDQPDPLRPAPLDQRLAAWRHAMKGPAVGATALEQRLARWHAAGRDPADPLRPTPLEQRLASWHQAAGPPAGRLLPPAGPTPGGSGIQLGAAGRTGAPFDHPRLGSTQLRPPEPVRGVRPWLNPPRFELNASPRPSPGKIHLLGSPGLRPPQIAFPPSAVPVLARDAMRRGVDEAVAAQAGSTHSPRRRPRLLGPAADAAGAAVAATAGQGVPGSVTTSYGQWDEWGRYWVFDPSTRRSWVMEDGNWTYLGDSAFKLREPDSPGRRVMADDPYLRWSWGTGKRLARGPTRGLAVTGRLAARYIGLPVMKVASAVMNDPGIYDRMEQEFASAEEAFDREAREDIPAPAREADRFRILPTPSAATMSEPMEPVGSVGVVMKGTVEPATMNGVVQEIAEAFADRLAEVQTRHPRWSPGKVSTEAHSLVQTEDLPRIARRNGIKPGQFEVEPLAGASGPQSGQIRYDVGVKVGRRWAKIELMSSAYSSRRKVWQLQSHLIGVGGGTATYGLRGDYFQVHVKEREILKWTHEDAERWLRSRTPAPLPKPSN